MTEFWPTWIMAAFYLTQLVRWPPHYEDEPWIWTPAINSKLGLGTKFPSFGYTTDSNPVTSKLFSWILDTSEFDFWTSARGLSLASLVSICIITVSLNKRFFKTETSVAFQAIFMTLPLADGLLYARLEVYCLVIASLGILMSTSNSLAVKYSSSFIFALAASIHPLALVLMPFLLLNPKLKINHPDFQEAFRLNVIVIKLTILVISLAFLNISSILNWSDYLKTLKRTGASSSVFSEFHLDDALLRPIKIIRNSVSQFGFKNQNFELTLTICFFCFLIIGINYIWSKNKRWFLCIIISVLLHVVLVRRTEVYYLVIFSPFVATIFSIRFDKKRFLRQVSTIALLVCATKVTLVCQFPSMLSRVTPTQFALDAQSPYDYSKDLLAVIPKNSVIVGSPILRAVFENRSDVKVYGMTALTEANDKFGQQIHSCKQVLNQLEKIFSRHENDHKFLILYGNWQARAFMQYSQTFTEEDFLCVTKDINKTQTISGISSNGISWNWVIRQFGN